MAQKRAISQRMLISVKVSGSPGPIRLLVNVDDSVAGVIGSVLKQYARQHRLPVLSNDPDSFDFCCGSVDRALSSCMTIGSTGCRNFSMCQKVVNGGLGSHSRCEKRVEGRFRSLLSKSLNLISIASI